MKYTRTLRSSKITKRLPQHVKVTVARTSQATDTSICSQEALSMITEHDGEPSHLLAAMLLPKVRC